MTNFSYIPQPRTTAVSNACILFFDSAVSQKNSLQINVHINHPDSEFTLVSKDVSCEAFVLLEEQIEMQIENMASRKFNVLQNAFTGKAETLGMVHQGSVSNR